jgi:hypothetical protein
MRLAATSRPDGGLAHHRQRGLFGGQGQGGVAQVCGFVSGGTGLSASADVSPESKTAAAIRGSARAAIKRDLMRTRMVIARDLPGG